ncbi:MAG: hypothetical protein DWQ47_09450 [Acidobacteria bacterium]|nr:MAG: hypothetical protein DWQ32_17550 [Acidobacteriota bacterium]REJ98874.1 MAG: hypothetical protein DWQ38_12425 [Acidobacteriota bacterium]REK16406.1 MAG: hypothetical protein DWQ43_05260 [Acidobacteriota bacterium]REK44087.1 MAG: hypothetical protein DWQ47_09450 [Acidobacteriota bacterium]
MTKTEKELAFLRGIYVEPEYTAKFTELFNENVVVDGVSTITYVNAGAGGHAIEIGDKLGEGVDVFPVCEDAELREIAQQKSESVKSGVDFSTEAPLARSEMAIADASLITPRLVDDFLESAAKCSSGRFAFFLPTAGSFGEVFSILWEVLLDEGLENKGEAVENLITEIKTVSQAEEAALALGLTKVQSISKPEMLEFENGESFVDSPLVRYFFLPEWLSFLDDEETERVLKGLAEKIDDDRNEITFRTSVKATVIWGEKTGG